MAVSGKARTHLGVSSVGPFLVSRVNGTHVWVRSLTTGRERCEHRVNMKPLALEFEHSDGG